MNTNARCSSSQGVNWEFFPLKERFDAIWRLFACIAVFRRIRTDAGRLFFPKNQRRRALFDQGGEKRAAGAPGE